MMLRLAAVMAAALVFAAPAGLVRASAHLDELPPGAGHVPDLPHDARDVRRAGGAADPSLHREEDRRVLDDAADRIGARGELRSGDSRAAIAQGSSTCCMVAADLGRARWGDSPASGVWRWSRRKEPGPPSRTSRRTPGSTRRPSDGSTLPWHASTDGRQTGLMGGRLGISFAAGFVSVVLPCVLPLVPGYLRGALHPRGRPAGPARHRPARRRLQHPVHLRLHRRLRRPRCRSRRGRQLSSRRRPARSSRASSSSCSGLRSSAFCPCRSERWRPACSPVAARGSGALLGGAFAVCAAPCIGTRPRRGARPREHARHCPEGNRPARGVRARPRSRLPRRRPRLRPRDGCVPLAPRPLQP